MGICSSGSSKSASVSTAKLILDDGELLEFSYPVKVSYVLQKNPVSFICSADEMDFDGVVSAVGDDEELQPGQLYFALPLSRMKRRLQAVEMAALAVKASSALRDTVVFPGEIGVRPSAKAAGRGNVGESARRRSRMTIGGGGGKEKSTAKLSAIPE